MEYFMKIHQILFGCNECRNCPHYDKELVECNAGGKPGEYCIINGEEFNRKLNLHKYVVCEARDISGRLYILSLNDGIDIYHKNGWWNMFTLASEDISEIGIWLCEIQRFTYDKNGHDMCIVKPMKLMGSLSYVKSNMNAMFLFSKSKRFAVSKGFSCINSDYDSYTEYNYRNAYEALKETYDNQLFWMNEIILAKKLLNKYIDGKLTLEEINKAVTSESREFFWTSKEFDNRCVAAIFNSYKYQERYELAYKKANGSFNRQYIRRMLLSYEDLVREEKIKSIDLYDPEGDHMDLLDMIQAAAEYYYEIYSAKKAAEKAARKQKRLEKKKKE